MNHILNYGSITPSSISQDEINSILWKACSTFFRGIVNPSEHKNYFIMLFVKYIRDVWPNQYKQYLDKIVKQARGLWMIG